jgi:hypothetical protein
VENPERRRGMEEKSIAIDCDLLTWIKDRAERSPDCQIIFTVREGRIVGATCYMTDTFRKG